MMSATVVPWGADCFPSYGSTSARSGRKTAPSIVRIAWPRARNFASSCVRSTPLSITPTTTPSPVARGSRRIRSGVSSANRSSKIVRVSGMNRLKPRNTRKECRMNSVLFRVFHGFSSSFVFVHGVEHVAEALDDADAMADGGGAVPQGQHADRFRQFERRIGIDGGAEGGI